MRRAGGAAPEARRGRGEHTLLRQKGGADRPNSGSPGVGLRTPFALQGTRVSTSAQAGATAHTAASSSETMAPPSVTLRNRGHQEQNCPEDGDPEVPPPLPLSVRLAGWMLGIVGALIAAGVVCILLVDGDGPGPLGNADSRGARRPPPPSAASRFWQQLWHGKPARANTTAARESLLAEAKAACAAGGARTPAHLVDVKLEIRWGFGDIQQHRTVKVVLPGRTLGSAAVAPPSVSELWRLCTFAATRRDAFNLRCARDRLFLEVGSGAASLAMAARGMLVRAETLHTEALEELQCLNGRRLCLSRLSKEREKEGRPPRNARGGANTSLSSVTKRGDDLAARYCCTQLDCAGTWESNFAQVHV